jgi:acrylyl-CoA reductase (NADPH)
LTTKQAMAIGTAGFSAMLALQALEDQGLKTDEGPVLITGAAGGVGSIATTILAHAGYEVAAVTGRPEAAEYLKDLGASQIVQRSDLNEVVKRPMEAATWAGCIDAVGGEMLARLLGQLKYGASVAVVGNASGTAVPANVIPFLLRGINMLGIDSAAQPYDNRVRAWNRIVSDLPLDKLDAMMTEATLQDLPALGRDIQNGKIKGRVVVDVNK